MTPRVNALAASKDVTAPYHNRRVALVNDHEVRMSVMTEGFPWHCHPDSDEGFLVIDGQLVIELQDREIVLDKGDFFTVPKGVVHRTRPQGKRSVNLTFEKENAVTFFL